MMVKHYPQSMLFCFGPISVVFTLYVAADMHASNTILFPFFFWEGGWYFEFGTVGQSSAY